MLTYEKAKELYDEGKLQSAIEGNQGYYSRLGCRFARYLRIVKLGEQFSIIRNGVELFSVTKNNEYILGFLEVTGVIRNIINRHTPANMKIVNKRFMLDNLPYFVGLRLTQKGDALISEAFSRRSGKKCKCETCGDAFTTRSCASCYEDSFNVDD